MRRNIGNELIVALLAAVSLLFAALFAIFLSSSTQSPPAPTATVPASITSAPEDIAQGNDSYRRRFASYC